jgi:hypothetical protein
MSGVMLPTSRSLETPSPPHVAQRERRVASGSDARTSPGRLALHVAVGVLGWAAIAGLWVWQLEVFVPANWLAGLKLIAIFLAITALFTPTWVWWNRNIYRRRHRRKMPLLRSVDFTEDALGRRIAAAPDELARAAEIEISVTDEGRIKVYAPVPDARRLKVPAGRG